MIQIFGFVDGSDYIALMKTITGHEDNMQNSGDNYSLTA